MKAVIRNGDQLPCIIYWTGRVRFHAGVVTWCAKERDASDGVVQVKESLKCCAECEDAFESDRFPQVK